VNGKYGFDAVFDRQSVRNVKMKPIFFQVFISLIGFMPATNIYAQNVPCKTNPSTLLFAGTPLEQSRCLLRPNKIGGVLGEELKKLPDPLEKIIGQSVLVKKEALRKYLKKTGVDEISLGGSLDDALSKAKLPSGEETQAFISLFTTRPRRISRMILFQPISIRM
jgi:hypothetical protein